MSSGREEGCISESYSSLASRLYAEGTVSQFNECGSWHPWPSPPSRRQAVHQHPHCLRLGHGSPVDDVWCPFSPAMRLLFCIFTFWGVCNGVRADSGPTGVGVFSTWKCTYMLPAGHMAWGHLGAVRFSPPEKQGKNWCSLTTLCFGSCAGRSSQIHLRIAWQRASWEFSKYLWQTRISTIIRATLLHTLGFRKAVEIRLQNHLSTWDGPKNTWLCIFWA